MLLDLIVVQHFIVYKWIFRFLSTEAWKVSLSTRLLWKNTWCVTLVQAGPPFLDAWTEPKMGGRHLGDLEGGWQEGCLGGSDLPSLHFPTHRSFLNCFRFSCFPSLPAPSQTTIPLSFFFFILYFCLIKILFSPLSHAGLQVIGDRGRGWRRGARAWGGKIRGDTGRTPPDLHPPQQHPYWAGGAHQSVVRATMLCFCTVQLKCSVFINRFMQCGCKETVVIIHSPLSPHWLFYTILIFLYYNPVL